MQNQPVVGVTAERLRDDLLEFRLDHIDILAGREASSVAHAKNVRVDGEGLRAERGVEDYISGLAPDPGEPRQRGDQMLEGRRELRHPALSPVRGS